MEKQSTREERHLKMSEHKHNKRYEMKMHVLENPIMKDFRTSKEFSKDFPSS